MNTQGLHCATLSDEYSMVISERSIVCLHLMTVLGVRREAGGEHNLLTVCGIANCHLVCGCGQYSPHFVREINTHFVREINTHFVREINTHFVREINTLLTLYER